MWRELMGDRVLHVDMNASETLNETIVVHAWCSAVGVRDRIVRSRPTRGTAGGPVTLGYLNVGKNSTQIHLGNGTASDTLQREEFFFTAPDGDMQADAVLLNGSPLGVTRDGVLNGGRRVRGRMVLADASLVLPPQSYGFVVLTNIGAPACQ